MHTAVAKCCSEIEICFFLGLSFKMCKFRANINGCCASCKANLQDFQILLISKGFCDSENTPAECYVNELLRKRTLK